MRIVSWNIDRRADGLAQRLDRLAEFGAEVVLLQEIERRTVPALRELPGFDWVQAAVEHSEPGRGSPTRLGPAILGTDRVMLLAAGQVPRERFVAAGQAAGLTEDEVDRIGWRHKTVYADIDIDGHPVRLCSFHARPGTGGGGGRPYVGWVKQLFHRVCADWLAEHNGTTIVGVDANSPKVDHPDADRWEPFMAGEATLIGPQPHHQLDDALYRWLERHPEELDRIRAERPQGPLAITHVLRRSGQPRRYDHLLVTVDLDVDAIEHREPHADGSDHGAIVVDLSLSGRTGHPAAR